MAKSAHLPVRRLIENNPALRSSRIGFRATTRIRTCGRQAASATSDGSTCNAAWFTRAKSVIVETELTGRLLNDVELLQDSIQASDQADDPSP